MSKVRIFLVVAAVLLLCMVFGGIPVFGASLQKPVIYSYYWPITEGQKDLLNWNMETPTIIDVPDQGTPKFREAEAYWTHKGKVILYRVNPFKGINTEDEMYDRFAKNMANSKGIAIDELVLNELTKKKADMFVATLKKVRQSYPDRIIAIWCAGNWNAENSFVLETIRDYSDMFLPELYVSQKTAGRLGLVAFKRYIKDAEALVPGITKKMVAGLGMHPKMSNDPSKNFGDHLSSQIKLLGTDPFFKSLLGIAMYAPVYLSVEDQKRIDDVLKQYFSR